MTTAENPCTGKAAITTTSTNRFNAASMSAILEEFRYGMQVALHDSCLAEKFADELSRA